MSEPSNPYEPAPPVAGSSAGQPSAYGTPMPQAEYGAPPRPVGPPPSSVVNATRLMFIGAALGLIGLIVLVTNKDSLRDAIAKKNPGYDPDKLNTAVNVAVSVGMVLGVIFIVLYVLLALQVRKGKNWARIVTWILTGIGVLSALGSLGQPAAGASRISGLIGGVVDLAIIILLAQKVSNQYFRKRVG